MASRRNADFLAFASTIVSLRRGITSLNGIAGEPPPDPTSMSSVADAGRERAAAQRLEQQPINRLIQVLDRREVDLAVPARQKLVVRG